MDAAAAPGIAPEHWTGAAVLAAIAAVLAAAAFVAAAWIGVGRLHPSTSPLEWPAADPRLIAAILFLAVPGLRRLADPRGTRPRGS